ncbi:hypothetical protein [uncultured Flavobacterium sp.]|uniref:hypothetical protein n=1 Tax=uncultured Flavobacterium sp. TaxID=165435 RepID=UPI0025CE6679|nr:hypothetical protein [uncultured Flavobacterium sp.]
MKTQSILKSTFAASLLIAGMSVTSSCDSCSRKENTDDSSTYTEGETVDTTAVTAADSTVDATSGAVYGSGNNADAGGSASGTPAAGNATTTGKSGQVQNSGMSQQEITDQVENSSSSPRRADGKPVNSGGTSGSGMGTGTGSTGNNSKVTRPEDQKGN